MRLCVVAIAAFVVCPLSAARYALILEDAPASAPHSQLASVSGHRATIAAAQASLRANLEARKFPVSGAVQTLLNAVFVEAKTDQVPMLKQLPGVKMVVRLGVRHPHLDRAAALINAPAAWNALGGIPNGGLGMKIGIIDTGIDQNHPGFNDPTLPAQPHLCTGADCAFTNNKVIVARSYVSRLGAGTGPNPAANSRPDDFSPRDRVGHGTAVAMVAGGNTNTGPNGTITGIAPKAYIGNYKVYGSSGVNPGATDDVLILALEDAFKDGMDVVNFSSGSFAFSGALDSGAACGNDPGVPCDLLAQTYDTAVRNGLVVVVSAGNDGNSGQQTPALATVSSPSTAPGAISVAASTNSHVFLNGISVSGPNVPTSLTNIAAEFGDGPVPQSPLTARLKDAGSVGDPQACTALPAHSLEGTIAIVARSSNCLFATKVQNAQSAGAVAVIFTLANEADSLVVPGGLTGTLIPSVLIGQADGQALRQFVAANPSATATLDLAFLAARDATPDVIADFSSRGPAFNGGAVKPELTAVGTDIYMAAQRIDPSGDLYSADGYTVASGTSFSSPMTAGAAALVKQKHPLWNTSQIKSALVNSTVANVLTEAGSPAPVGAQGSGKLDVAAAVNATVTLSPSSVFFGVQSSTNTLAAVPIQVTNNGTATLTLTATAPAPVTLTGGDLILKPNQTGTVTLSLPATPLAAGNYSGQVNFAGANGALHVPFVFIVGDHVAYNAVILAGDSTVGNVGTVVPDGEIAFQVTDQYGAPVENLPVRFSVSRGGGSLTKSDSVTNAFGIATAVATLGPNPGANVFVGIAGGLTVRFEDDARAQPTIAETGVLNAASSALGDGIVPGSYISIYGSGLSDTTNVSPTPTLPLALDSVSVSFDAPGVSLPGRIYYVSPNQVNVQVPWELAGQTSVQIKVSIDQSSGTLVTVPVAPVSPALFVYGQSQAAALDENASLVGTANPARRGSFVSLFANSLGPVSVTPGTGDPAPATPLSVTTNLPVVTIGGVTAKVQFSGLAPGFTGLYQINVEIPATVAAGSQPITVAIAGVVSPVARIAVQ